MAGLLMVFFAKAQGESGVYCEPRVIDIETDERETIESSIKVANKLDRYVELTPLVIDLYSILDGPEQPADAANVKPFSYWVILHRGAVRLAPGEEQEFPLKIDIPKYAVEGTYYAYAVYSEGKNLADPGKISALNGQLATLIRFKLKKKMIEEAELSGLKADKNIFFKPPASFSFAIRNIGSEPVSASGFLRIYDRRGEEVENFNIEKDQILPGEESGVAESWNPKGGFGKYQAKLAMQYGTLGKRDLSGSIYFWILPWQLLAAFLAVVLFVFILFLYLIFRRGRALPKK